MTSSANQSQLETSEAKEGDACQLVSQVKFSDLTASRFIGWVTLGLMTPGNKTMLFCDARALNGCQGDTVAAETLKHAELLIPRGKALKLQLASMGVATSLKTTAEQFYDELFLEIEHRQLSTVILVDKKALAAEVDQLLAQRYPGLVYRIETLGDQYRFSTSELADSLSQSGSKIVVSLLPSPQRERMFSRLNQRMANQLFIGVGEGLPEALLELHATESSLAQRARLWLRKRRHSLVLSPTHWPAYIWRWLAPKGEQQPGDVSLNQSVYGSPWRVRLQRTLIAAKSTSFRLKRSLTQTTKRLLDLLGVGTGILLLSPLLAIVAFIIKVTSPGPIFYSQIRVGLRGKRFRMWKFRSMYIDADQRKAELEAQNEMAGGVLFKMKHDPRITPVGRIIRRLSIDELPQLLNVLTGEMSLVGPRPALPKEVEAYPVLARARLEVKPGLTGLWQISGRSDLPFDKQVLLDTAYVHTQSTSNDIKLIAKTIPAVVSGKGAY